METVPTGREHQDSEVSLRAVLVTSGTKHARWRLLLVPADGLRCTWVMPHPAGVTRLTTMAVYSHATVHAQGSWLRAFGGFGTASRARGKGERTRSAEKMPVRHEGKLLKKTLKT